jgi:transcription elongation factor Elf1
MNKPRILPEGVVELQGRTYPLFAYALNQAHEAGLQSLVIEPDYEAMNCYREMGGAQKLMWICKATATMQDGRVFVARGDASPENVGRTVIPAYLRVAETRAAGRCLRMAANVAACLWEELGDLEVDQVEQQQPVQKKPQQPQEAAQNALQTLPPPPKADDRVFCQKDGCGALLSDDEVAGCLKHAARLDGGMFCKPCGIAYLEAKKARTEENPDATEAVADLAVEVMKSIVGSAKAKIAEEREAQTEAPTLPHRTECVVCGAVCDEARIKVSQRLHSGSVVCKNCEDTVQPYLGNRLGHASAV